MFFNVRDLLLFSSLFLLASCVETRQTINTHDKILEKFNTPIVDLKIQNSKNIKYKKLCSSIKESFDKLNNITPGTDETFFKDKFNSLHELLFFKNNEIIQPYQEENLECLLSTYNRIFLKIMSSSISSKVFFEQKISDYTHYLLKNCDSNGNCESNRYTSVSPSVYSVIKLLISQTNNLHKKVQLLNIIFNMRSMSSRDSEIGEIFFQLTLEYSALDILKAYGEEFDFLRKIGDFFLDQRRFSDEKLLEVFSVKNFWKFYGNNFKYTKYIYPKNFLMRLINLNLTYDSKNIINSFFVSVFFRTQIQEIKRDVRTLRLNNISDFDEPKVDSLADLLVAHVMKEVDLELSRSIYEMALRENESFTSEFLVASDIFVQFKLKLTSFRSHEIAKINFNFSKTLDKEIIDKLQVNTKPIFELWANPRKGLKSLDSFLHSYNLISKGFYSDRFDSKVQHLSYWPHYWVLFYKLLKSDYKTLRPTYFTSFEIIPAAKSFVSQIFENEPFWFNYFNSPYQHPSEIIHSLDDALSLNILELFSIDPDDFYSEFILAIQSQYWHKAFSNLERLKYSYSNLYFKKAQLCIELGSESSNQAQYYSLSNLRRRFFTSEVFYNQWTTYIHPPKIIKETDIKYGIRVQETREIQDTTYYLFEEVLLDDIEFLRLQTQRAQAFIDQLGDRLKFHYPGIKFVKSNQLLLKQNEKKNELLEFIFKAEEALTECLLRMETKEARLREKVRDYEEQYLRFIYRNFHNSSSSDRRTLFGSFDKAIDLKESSDLEGKFFDQISGDLYLASSYDLYLRIAFYQKNGLVLSDQKKLPPLNPANNYYLQVDEDNYRDVYSMRKIYSISFSQSEDEFVKEALTRFYTSRGPLSNLVKSPPTQLLEILKAQMHLYRLNTKGLGYTISSKRILETYQRILNLINISPSEERFLEIIGEAGKFEVNELAGLMGYHLNAAGNTRVLEENYPLFHYLYSMAQIPKMGEEFFNFYENVILKKQNVDSDTSHGAQLYLSYQDDFSAYVALKGKALNSLFKRNGFKESSSLYWKNYYENTLGGDFALRKQLLDEIQELEAQGAKSLRFDVSLRESHFTPFLHEKTYDDFELEYKNFIRDLKLQL